MKPNPSERDAWDCWADQVLRQLPPRPTPPGLAPRVLAEVQRRRALPWYRRPWRTWPRGPRILSLPALLLALVAVSQVEPSGARLAAALSTPFESAFQALATIRTVGDALQVLAQSLVLALGQVSPATFTALVFAAVVAWLGTLGLGTAAWRLARLNR